MSCHTKAVLLGAAVFCCSSGCLFVHHSTRIVRDKEATRPVQFQSQQARQSFLAGVHELQAHKQSSGPNVTAVPFLWWYSSATELSDNAIYNDQISACDTNADGIISTEEALAYRAAVTEQIRSAERPKTEEHHATVSVPLSTGPPSAESSMPPGLIHTATRTSAGP
jgi:hypothetical protein